MNEVDNYLQQMRAYVDAHEELKKVTEAMLDGMASDLDDMEDGYDKHVVLDFLSKHLMPYFETMNFMQSLYSPQSGGDSDD